MTAVLGRAAELERQSIYYRLKSGRDKYIRDGGKIGKPKGSGVKDKTGYSPSTVQRIKRVFSL